MAGINVLAYGPHSFRSAASSKAFECGLALSSIMKQAGWKCEGTFVKHYLKHVKQKIPGSLIDKPTVTPMPSLSQQHGVQMGMKIKAEQVQISKNRNFAERWDITPPPPIPPPPPVTALSHQEQKFTEIWVDSVASPPIPCTVSRPPPSPEDNWLQPSPPPHS